MTRPRSLLKKLIFGGKNRHKIETAALVLKRAKDEREPVPLSDLSYGVGSALIKTLIEMDLLELVKNPAYPEGAGKGGKVAQYLLSINPAGEDFLKHFEDLKELVDDAIYIAVDLMQDLGLEQEVPILLPDRWKEKWKEKRRRLWGRSVT